MRIRDNGEIVEACGYWGAPGNHLFVAPSCHCHNKKEQKSKVCDGIKDFDTISHFEWDTDVHVGKMRKLVSESRVIFLGVQKLARESTMHSEQTGAELPNEYLNFSHQYMSSLKSTSSEIQAQLKSEEDQKQREVLEKQLKILEPFEMLWGLFEVIFIDNTRGGYVLGQLMEWMRLHFYDNDLKVQKVIKSQQGEKHELYWEVMYNFVLQGRIEEARRLLMLHSESRSVNCVQIDLLLEHMPIYSPSNPRLSFTEWSKKWQQWHMTCTEHVKEDVFAGDDKLSLLCKILAGEEEAFTELKEVMGTWYCLLISKLFYQSPMIPSSALRHFTQPCIDLFGSEVMTSWDKVIQSIFHLDIKQAIDECCSSFNNWWFVCHMTDLLEHKGCLEQKILPFGSSLREFVLLEYVNSLISDGSLLEVGIDYLTNCPVFGRAHIGELVLRAHLETDVKVQKMVRICEKYDLQEEAGIICRERGLRDLRDGFVSSALYWCIRAKDDDLADLLVRKILLEGVVPAPELGQLDLINNFGSAIGFSNELALLGKVAEFQRQTDQALCNEAASTLFTIFSEKSSRRYWKFLFSRLVELLEVEELQLTKEQTKKFLQCLTEHELKEDYGDVKNKLPEDEMLKIRVHLAQSMALNFMNDK